MIHKKNNNLLCFRKRLLDWWLCSWNITLNSSNSVHLKDRLEKERSKSNLFCNFIIQQSLENKIYSPLSVFVPSLCLLHFRSTTIPLLCRYLKAAHHFKKTLLKSVLMSRVEVTTSPATVRKWDDNGSRTQYSWSQITLP